MAKSDLTLEVDVTTAIHNAIREVANNAAQNHGLKIIDVSVIWNVYMHPEVKSLRVTTES